MNRITPSFCTLAIVLVGLAGCSSEPAKEAKKAAIAPDKIQGKIQVLKELQGGSTEAAMNAGGASIYLWEGVRRYRLFLKAPIEVVHGDQYVVEGVYAQKAIDEIGDPDQGKNGYPLESSCERVVKSAWTGLSFDVADGHVSALKARIKRYPARPVFLVTKIQPVDSKDAAGGAAKSKEAQAAEDKIPEVTVAADKQKALLIEGPAVQPAPLWEPAGGTAKCKVVISSEGKISDLDTGVQLCEAVPWTQFRYQPPVQAGHPVKVNTEVEVRFEPRNKTS